MAGSFCFSKTTIEGIIIIRVNKEIGDFSGVDITEIKIGGVDEIEDDFNGIP